MKKDKAYILAFQRATNYGAVLQIFALKKVLEAEGLEVKVVDYIPDWMKVRLRNQPSVFSFIKRRIMNFTFCKMFRSLDFTDRSYSSFIELKNSLQDGDYYFVGSDQVWNTKIMKEDTTYLLDFVPLNAKRIGYAVSMGNNPVNDGFRGRIVNLINQFDFISAREVYVKDFVNSVTSKFNVPVVLDPTLLLEFEDYRKVKSEVVYKKKYIAVYSAMHDSKLYDLAFHLRKVTGLPIINLGHHFNGADKHEYLLGPGNWLNRISQASYFITNSFHGTVFAILSKVSFSVVPNEKPEQQGLNARFTELLNSLQLDKRLVYSISDLERSIKEEINHELVLSNLVKRRTDSMRFIKEAIGK